MFIVIHSTFIVIFSSVFFNKKIVYIKLLHNSCFYNITIYFIIEILLLDFFDKQDFF